MALPASSTVSELLRDFAAPLIYVDSEGPTNIDTLRTALMLAMICWNVPVYEATGSALYTRGVETLREIMQNVPDKVAAALKRLLSDRTSKFASAPFLVLVEVHGDTLMDATIVAEARAPKLRTLNLL
jgi:hypothetical protein